MARRVFFSFHFKNDFWRTQQVRNINAISGQSLATPQKWEEVKRKGDSAVKEWIDGEMKGKGCLVVLIGSDTASRKWVKYEIEKAWNDKKGILGIHVNKLKDSNSQTSSKGVNPFSTFTMCEGRVKMSSVVPIKTPAGANSRETYSSIANNLDSWIEEAIKARQDFKC